MAQVPPAQAQAVKDRGYALLDSPATGAHAFYMAVDEEPFDDVRVRQAIRLLADREELVAVALGGLGTVANDLYGQGMEYYDDSLPQRERDVEQAKQLLADAGYPDGLTLTLETSNVAPGVTEAATLFQQQAAEGGVTIEIANVDPSAYFDPSQKYLKMPFAQTYWAGGTTLSGFYPLALVPGQYGNETHWDRPETTAAIEEATSATDPAVAEESWLEVQAEQYDDGGYLWWANVNNVDATATGVKGITPSRYYSLGLPWSLAGAYVES
jgi:peptide/nickel transport system substrate-binding protein